MVNIIILRKRKTLLETSYVNLILNKIDLLININLALFQKSLTILKYAYILNL